MGAAEFSDIATGATAEEAFNAAVSEAQYQYGHAGYTGTLAEKGSFTMISGVDFGDLNPRAVADRALSEGPESADPMVARIAAAVDDKWGPAGCIDITASIGTDSIPAGQRAFLFFGWASS